MGTDQWNQIDQWAEPDKLRDLLTFIVLTRDGDDVMERDGWRHIAVPFDHPASSRKIRAAYSKYRHWLPPAVADYCVQNKLYYAR
ncbi:MAG: hypothetical protein AAF226_14220 [Verrucomicrobiota bacterium]